MRLSIATRTPRVERVLADRPPDRGVSEEFDAIVDGLAGDLCDPRDDGILVVGGMAGERVDIGRGGRFCRSPRRCAAWA